MANEITLSANATATTPTAQFSVQLSAIASQTGNMVVNQIQRIGAAGELLDFGDITGVPVLLYVENLSLTATVTLALDSGMTDTFATIAPMGYVHIPPSAAAIYASAAIAAVTATAALTPTTVASIAVSAGGTGYTSAPTVTVTNGGSGAVATAVIAGYAVTSLTVVNSGFGYVVPPAVTFTGGGAGTGATAVAVLTGDKITSYRITAGGTGYTTPPTVVITAGAGATGTATLAATTVASIAVTNTGSRYTTAPTVTISGGGGTGATATASLSGYGVLSITLTNGGSGYTYPPTITFTGGGGTGAAATANMNPSTVSSITVTNPGSGYTSVPTVALSGGSGTGATATVTLTPTSVQGVTVTANGSAYNKTPLVVFTGGGGTGAAGTARRTGAGVYTVVMTARGSGYTSQPTFTLIGGGGYGAAMSQTRLDSLGINAAYFSARGGKFDLGVLGAVMAGEDGFGYLEAPVVVITGGGGTGATATTTLQSAVGTTVQGVTMTAPGSGYTTVPTVSFVSNSDGTGSDARFNSPRGIASDGTNLFVADYTTHVIRKIVIATGVVTTFAGTSGTSGGADGTGLAATFSSPRGLIVVGANLYVSDLVGATIRKIVISTGVVTTLAGTYNSTGSTDATGSAARFSQPNGLASDGTNLFVADSANNTIRQIVISSGVVTTLAGTAGASGSTDATGAAARFVVPAGLALAGVNLFVADGRYTIRQIVISSGVVTTIAGTYNTSGLTDGTGAAARFNSSDAGLSSDGTNLFLAESGAYGIRQIVISSAVVTTLAGVLNAIGSADGTGAAARFYNPYGVVREGADLYVTDTVNHTVRKVVISSAVVTTPAGTAGSPGASGTGATATASLTPVSIASIAVVTAGSGYLTPPTPVFSGGGGTGAAATASVVSTSLASITVTASGAGYTSLPTVVFTGDGTGAAGTAVQTTESVASIAVTGAGSGYTSTPTVSFSGGGGTGATAVVSLTGAAVSAITLTNPGSVYRSKPTVTLTGGGGTGATATASITATTLGSVALSSAISQDYDANLTLPVTSGGGTGATVTPVFVNGVLTEATVTAAGTGFTSAPTVTLTNGVGVPVQVLAVET